MSITIKQENEEMEVDLADIAGINMDEVEAFEGGFEPTPKGVYIWNVTDAGLDSIETSNGEKGAIYFELECEECLALVDEDKDPESMIGWKHKETIFISDLAKSVGQAKALMQNAGFQGSGTLQELLDAFCGHRFVAPVKQRRDKNDTDRVYANIVIAKTTPVPAGDSAA